MKPLVVVVDDSLTVRMDIGEALDAAGFQPVLCADLSSARDILARQIPVLVVLDVQLPDGDGIQFLRELKGAPATAHRPVLLLASEADAVARGAGGIADAYAAKPYDLPALVSLARGLTASRAKALATVGRSDEAGRVSMESGKADSMRGKHLLAVDDSVTYLEELGSQLRDEGYHVVLARSGEEALTVLEGQRVDGILLDLIMPGLTGQETCRRIKQRPEWRDIPLVMLTARDDRNAMIDGIYAGADDYIAKSADFDLLKARLHGQLRRKHMEDENSRIREELVRQELEAAARDLVEAQRRKMDQGLRDQQFYTRSLIEANIDAIITTDPLGIITDVNKQMEALTGCSRDELIGAPFKSHFTDPVRADAAITLALGQRRITDYELTACARGGHQTVVSCNATTFYDRDRKLQGVFAAARDITERKRQEQDLRDSNVELGRAHSAVEKASLAKSDFLSRMSHELRSPLNAILGFSQLLELGPPLPSESQQESIAQILRAGWHLLDLINKILELTVIESGGARLVMSSVSVAEVLAECRVDVERAARQRAVTTTFPGLGAPMHVRADRDRLKQVITILLSNAIRYNHERGTVVVDSVSCGPGRTRISVTDTGVGLSTEELAKLFQPFDRLGQETSSVSGTGVGLVVAKRLVELMQGILGVESTEGVGSVFWVDLPNAAAPGPQA